jgi:bifunctional DNase/RNase
MIAASDTDLVPMRVSKAVGLNDGGDISEYMVLDERHDNRHLVIQVGHAEAFSLAASLQGMEWPRPAVYQFTVALVRSLSGRVCEVRLDRIVDGAYAATVEVAGPQGVGLVDARSSDALNIAVLTDAPVFVSAEMLAECISRQERDSAEAALLLRALEADPMIVRRADR